MREHFRKLIACVWIFLFPFWLISLVPPPPNLQQLIYASQEPTLTLRLADVWGKDALQVGLIYIGIVIPSFVAGPIVSIIRILLNCMLDTCIVRGLRTSLFSFFLSFLSVSSMGHPYSCLSSRLVGFRTNMGLRFLFHPFSFSPFLGTCFRSPRTLCRASSFPSCSPLSRSP